MSDETRDQPFYLHPADVAASFSAAAPGYDEAAVLQRAVREQLLERLDLVALEPRCILEAGVATGASFGPLRARYPQAELIGVDMAANMLALARAEAARVGQARCLRADCHDLPLRAGCVDMAFSNLMLPWCHDPEAVLREFRRVLATGGLLTFSTLGPDTLRELRSAWAAADRYTHVNYFYDMHDIGDALQRAGFAGPVMDVDYYTLTWGGALEMMRDLQANGAHNLTAGRPRGLTGRGRFARVVAALEALLVDGRLAGTFEVIFGHAWAPDRPTQTTLADGSVGVPVSGIGRSARET